MGPTCAKELGPGRLGRFSIRGGFGGRVGSFGAHGFRVSKCRVLGQSQGSGVRFSFFLGATGGGGGGGRGGFLVIGE